MTHEDFNAVLRQIQEDQAKVLTTKSAEYSSDHDKLANFKSGASALGSTPAQCLWGYAMKHLISIQDMVKAGEAPTQAKAREKLGDAMNYLALLEAIWTEERGDDLGYKWGINDN